MAKKKSQKTVQVREGQWVRWHQREMWECCDCALTHNVEIKTVKRQLYIRMFRNNRSTAQRRRARKLKEPK